MQSSQPLVTAMAAAISSRCAGLKLVPCAVAAFASREKPEKTSGLALAMYPRRSFACLSSALMSVIASSLRDKNFLNAAATLAVAVNAAVKSWAALSWAVRAPSRCGLRKLVSWFAKNHLHSVVEIFYITSAEWLGGRGWMEGIPALERDVSCSQPDQRRRFVRISTVNVVAAKAPQASEIGPRKKLSGSACSAGAVSIANGRKI